MQIDVYFPKWGHAKESMARGESILERQSRELDELCISIDRSEHSSLRQIAEKLRKQQELLLSECNSIEILGKTLEKVQDLYEHTENNILDSEETDIPIYSDSVGVRDLRKLRQLAASFFE
ncbi:MAG: hypothetical protein K2O96_06515 [Lachnospiraceae bacterium]|nr:hypothetical protein [Lachnospiraceae bacterium]